MFLDNHINQAEVSVIIPCYRCSRTVSRAIKSIMSQTIIPNEIILVDDCSGDGTWETLTSLRNIYGERIKVLQNSQNMGVAASRNIGWNASTQRLVAFLDADDTWHSKKIEIQYFYMTKNPSTLMSVHGFKIIKTSQSNLDWPLQNTEVKEIKRLPLLIQNKFITPSVMIRRECQLRFNDKRRYMEDRLLWLEIICSGYNIIYIQMELAAIYKRSYGESGLSGNIFYMGIADLQNYFIIYKKDLINIFEFIFLIIFSSIKFLKRIILVYGFYKLKRIAIK